MFIRFPFVPLVLPLVLALGACTPSTKQFGAVSYTPALREDWPVSTPTEQGLDPLLVSSLYHDAAELETLYGLLLIKNDQLIAEKYFNGSSIDHASDRMSTTKSYVSALTGLALQRGCLRSLDQHMIEFFPEYASSLGDSRKATITVKQLLQMRAGYPWEGNERPYFDRIFNSKNYDWLPLLAEFPLLHAPGTAFGYSNVTSHIVGAIVARACDTDLQTFARQFLFEPMGATLPKWHRAADGYRFGAFGIHTTARDMAKFGSVYMHQGKYRGEPLLRPEWVEASLARYSTGINFTGWFSSALGDYFEDLGYGYQWWSASVDGERFDFAWGHGGNLIVLLHERKLMIVTAADPLYDAPEEAGWEHEGAIIDVVGKFIESLPDPV